MSPHDHRAHRAPAGDLRARRPVRRRSPAVAARRHHRAGRAGALRRRARTGPRLPPRPHAPARQARALRALRPLGPLPRGHVPADGGRQRGGRAAADAVPAPHPRVRDRAAVGRGAAVSAGRGRRAVPVRALGRRRRALAGAPDDPQRRPRVLPTRSDRRRDRRRADDGRRGLRARSACRPPRLRLSRRGEGAKYVDDDELWARGEAILRDVLRRPRARLRRGRGGGRVLRPEDRPAGPRRARPRGDAVDDPGRLPPARASSSWRRATATGSCGR